MSKQQEARDKQGYRATPNACPNCKHYRSRLDLVESDYEMIAVEKDRRCALGGFAVKRHSVCNCHEFQED